MEFLADKIRYSHLIRKDDLYRLTPEFFLPSFHTESANFKTLTKILSAYLDMINRNFEKNSQNIIKSLQKRGEYFECQFGDEKKGYYYLIWNISRLESIIRLQGLKPQIFTTSELIPYIFSENITTRGMNRACKNTKPIIIAEIPYLRQNYIIVDGNHRLFYRNSIGDNFIKGYLLSPEQHTAGFVNDFFKKMFYVNWNAHEIIQTGPWIHFSFSDLPLPFQPKDMPAEIAYSDTREYPV